MAARHADQYRRCRDRHRYHGQDCVSQSGGRADVYLDDAKNDLVAEAYIVPKTHDNDLWRIHGLSPGEHTLRLVMRNDADPRSNGHKLTISYAVVYRMKQTDMH